MPIKTLKYENQILEIEQDMFALSPRDSEYDTLGTMVCSEISEFGDVQIKKHGWENYLESQNLSEDDLAVCLSMYYFEHSGQVSITYRKDLGGPRLGCIYVTKKQLREKYSVQELSKEMIDEAAHDLESEVRNYECYLSGDMYRAVLSEGTEDDKEEIDIGIGFYGRDIVNNGIADGIPDFDKFVEIEQGSGVLLEGQS